MIFLVDDDEYVRRGFGILFRSAGMQYQTFASAEDFLEGGNPCAGDLLILDIHMPGLSGCDLMDILSKRGYHIPLIVISAYDEPSSRECARKFGALAFLKKPIDSEELIGLILNTKN